MNARSLVSKINDLEVLVNEQNPDIILITETWLNKDISNSILQLEGYFIESTLRCDRTDTTNGIGGGLIVYVKHGITILQTDNINTFNQFCQFKVLSDNNQDLNITLVYRSPNSPNINNSELCELISSLGKNNLIIGDFNYPSIDWANNSCDNKCRPFVDALSERFLHQIIDFPTHIRGNILDLALTDLPERIINIEPIGNLGNSDHSIISLNIMLNVAFNQTNEHVPDWNKCDVDSFSDFLTSVNWESEFIDKGTEECWIYFKNRITQGMKSFIPNKRRRQNNKPPWMNRNILRLVRLKQRLYNTYMKSKDNSDFERFKECEKQVKKSVRQAKRRFEKNLSIKENKKAFNSYLRTKTKSRAGVGPLKKDGKLVSDNKTMANTLNSFFGSVFSDTDPTAIQVSIDQQIFGDPVSGVNISERDILKKINNLKSNSAAGPDNISAKFLQTFSSQVSVPLRLIFNKSLQTGEVPADWKCGNITPIFKKGPKSNPGNYRPVSLTSIPCKLLESIIKDKVTQHLYDNCLIKSSQHGFMRKRSCLTNLLEFFERVTKELDAGNDMDIVYLDFAKAFDKVSHTKLLNKLKSYGIQGDILNWIHSWLSNRKQRVVLNGEFSEWILVLSGVPQGSVLGPLLFIIFIDDIDISALNISVLNKFADDTKLGQVMNTDADKEVLQNCLNSLCTWADNWSMKFNESKCKILHVGKNNPGHEYYMNGIKLTESDEEKDLGVLINKSLKPASQCSEAARKANIILGSISRAFHYRDRYVFVNLYKTYVRPHLEFCTAAWSPWTEADSNCLELVQKRAVRMISGLTGKTYMEKLIELKLLSLEERRERADMIQTFKIIHGFSDVNPATWFRKINHNRVTRMANDPLNLEIQTSRTSIRNNFFSLRVPRKWNSIPQEVKQSTTVNIFKRSYDKFRQYP